MRFRVSILLVALLLIPAFGWLFWSLSEPETLSQSLESFGKLGDSVKESITSLPTIAPVKAESGYTVQDEGQNAIKISYANQDEAQKLESSTAQKLSLSFPQDPSKQPLKVNLPGDKAFSFQSLETTNYTASVVAQDPISNEASPLQDESQQLTSSTAESFFSKLFPKKEAQYLRYESEDGRKLLYYSYQSDGTTGEKTLKHWTIYRRGEGNEKETYSFEKALLKKHEDGSVSVYYQNPDQLKNQEGAAGVDTNLLERAQRVLAADALDTQEPDATIPAPYVLDKDGNRHDLSWEVSEDQKTLTVTINFTTSLASDGGQLSSLYPLALDPTLSFTAPAQSNTGDTITGEATNNSFGAAMTTGDFNSDGKLDLAVKASNYSTDTGRIYIFYNDGSLSVSATSADVTITGETTSNFFGASLEAGDLNADGKDDLVVGANGFSTYTGRVYIFYNDGSYSNVASSADVIITGEATNSSFSAALDVEDVNADGKDDLVIGAWQYSSCLGRVYLVYNDGNYPTAAGSADTMITGEAGNYCFGGPFAFIDFNNDGKKDIAIGNSAYSSNSGRIVIFYNDGSYPTAASAYDLLIHAGSSGQRFGYSLASGDFNSDGRDDLAAGGYACTTNTGCAYIFYNDGSLPGDTTVADKTFVGEATNNYFGNVRADDFNSDGKTDLAVGAYGYASNTGRIYIFYNDGAYPATTAADVVITGESTSSNFGVGLISADFNSDGKTDLIVGAYTYASSRGKVYIFYSQNGQVNTNQSITGNASGDKFGQAMITGDVNADGRTDLIIGAPEYNPGGAATTGRVYIFYGDGQIPSAANSADVVIVGEATTNYFGSAMTTGDFNADGEIDLAVGAYGYSATTGRVYLFYNDGSLPTTAATADIFITGGASGDTFGNVLASGDFNADGKTDLISGAPIYNSEQGRVYIFYSGAITTEIATGADVLIAGTASFERFGNNLSFGDFDADGKTDFAVQSAAYGSYVGRVYIFYNDGSYPASAGSADAIILGDGSFEYFGTAMVAGDFNADGRTDIAVGPGDNAGRVYIFYNDGSYASAAANADLIISGGTARFGSRLSSADLNADGRTDLVAGAWDYSTNTGRTYIFYNDGSMPTTVATADITITGETTSNYFGIAFATGDMNGDGRTDLIVGAYGYSTSTGRVYLYETRENFAWQLEKVSGTAASGGLRVQPNVTGQELSIVGEAGSYFSNMITGDFNTDGKTDLAVGAYGYNSVQGRIYIFYNDGNLPVSASSADVTILGVASSVFGASLSAADLNSDGKIDLAVGAKNVSGGNGAVYIFYNDGSYAATAANADVIITGESGVYFGSAMVTGDLNADGKVDLAAGGWLWNTETGRAYVFYNDGSFPTTAASADVIITGETTYGRLSTALAAGDLNADGKTDLVVGAYNHGTTGRVYVFYNGAIITENASGADVMITGTTASDQFGISLVTGDFNADGKIDLATGASYHSFASGAAYIFYNDGSYPSAAASAEVIIGGVANSDFGQALEAGDFNADGRMDLAVGAYTYHGDTLGRAYIFYNDGSIPTTAATADVNLTGEAASNYYGASLAALDMNSDGKTDLAVGAYGYSSNRGKVYIYTMNDTIITGGASGDYFGYAMTSGDFNADGKTDLAVGAYQFSSFTGRVYVFYNDGGYPSAVASADAIITGEAGSYFGTSLVSGDFNTDGKTDLAVGATRRTSYSGYVYLFYNGAIATEDATGADVTIIGSIAGAYFGNSLASGDFNADGRVDLAVGSFGTNSNQGKVYIFLNDGSIPTTIGTADANITGVSSGDYFGASIAAGDFNADGKTDLVAGSYQWSSSTGRTYIFYNGAIVTESASGADVILTGEGTSNYFGSSFSSGDLNSDGRIDLVVGSYGYSGGADRGRAYVFYNDGSFPATADTADIIITGDATNYKFGSAFAPGDFNADGKTDLAIGSWGYSTNTGRVHVFYNDGSIPTTGATADVILTGETTTNNFGSVLTAGDFNNDGIIDLAVGANAYNTNTGRVYLIISEAAVESVPNSALKTRGNFKVRGNFRVR